MANPKRTRFSRRVPDHVTNELVAVLSDKKTFGFKELFVVVYENLKARNAVSGGEEMLRLRAYEKLQNLVTRGLVEKNGKEYRGLENIADVRPQFKLTSMAMRREVFDGADDMISVDSRGKRSVLPLFFDRLDLDVADILTRPHQGGGGDQAGDLVTG